MDPVVMPSSKPERAWCIKTGDGWLAWGDTLAPTRRKAIAEAEQFAATNWRALYAKGCRAVRVTITEEQDD